MDSGAQIPRGYKIHGRSDIEAAARTILAPLSSLGASGVSFEASFDMDHGPFMAAGVPVFTLWVDDGEPDTRHACRTASTRSIHDACSRRGNDGDRRLQTWQCSGGAGRRLSAAEATELLARGCELDPLRRRVYEPEPLR